MGIFGENLTVSGLLEEEVRIGDVFRFGTTALQVMQPRIPCAKLNLPMGLRFSPMFLESRKVGYYLRVLQEAAALVNRHPDYHMSSNGGAAIPRAQDGNAAPFQLNAPWIASCLSLAQADFYLAGSRRCINRMVDDLSAAGVPAAALHAESFG